MGLTEHEEISLTKILEFIFRPSDIGQSYTKHNNRSIVKGSSPYIYANVYVHGRMKFYSMAFRLKSIHWDSFYCIVYDNKHVMYFFKHPALFGLNSKLKDKLRESISNYKKRCVE